MSRRLRIAVSGALVVAFAVVSVPPVTVAFPRSALPFSVPRDVVVDAERGRLFLTGNRHFVMADMNGTVLDSTFDATRPGGLAIHGDDLYIAKTGENRIDRVDLDTMEVVQSFSTLPLIEPSDLAYAGGRLWFEGYEDIEADCNGGRLASLHPDSGDVEYGADLPYTASLLTCFTLRDGPPGTDMFTTVEHRSPQVWDASDGELRSVLDDVPPNRDDAAISPDGKTAVVLPGGDVYSLESGDHIQTLSCCGNSGVYSPDGELLVSAFSTGVVVHSTADWQQVNGYPEVMAPTSSTSVAHRSVTFSPDGNTIFVVARRNGDPYLLALPRPPREAELTVTMPHDALFGESVTVTFRLDSEVPVTNRVIEYREEFGFAIIRERKIVLDESQEATIRVRASIPTQSARIFASWEGDDLHHPADDFAGTRVRARIDGVLVGAEARGGGRSSFDRFSDLRYEAILAPGGPVQFELQKAEGGGWRTIGSQVSEGDTLAHRERRKEWSLLEYPARGSYRIRARKIEWRGGWKSTADTPWSRFRLLN